MPVDSPLLCSDLCPQSASYSLLHAVRSSRSCLTPTQEALATWEALTLVHSWDKCIYSLTGVTGVHGAHTQAQIDVLD